MPTVSLNAFLKILTKGSPQKAIEYGRYLTPGGYDFYWLLKDAARGLTVGGKSLEDCTKVIEKIDRLVEKKHNLSALKSLDGWLKKREIHEFFEAPSSSYVSPAGHITIKIEPAFGYVKDGHRHIVHAWSSQTLALPNKVASCGLYLMQQKLCVDAFADCIAGILDTRKREHFYGRAVPMIIPAMIASELAWADSFFETVAKAA